VNVQVITELKAALASARGQAAEHLVARPGVDISAPGGTTEYAVCSGTIVLHGIGGFGPWAPVLHCDRPLAGYGYVYYGHAGPANQLTVGTHVSASQVMSEVGPGIVGISFGPHLQIGFADLSGGPIGSGSAPAMLALLRAAYRRRPLTRPRR
jgi:hypothetical protein